MLKRILKNFNKGFSLAETLVVVTLVGVLSTVLYTNYSKYLSQSKEKVVFAEMYDLLEAFELKMMENAELYPDIEENHATWETFRTYDELYLCGANGPEVYEVATGKALPQDRKFYIDQDPDDNDNFFMYYQHSGYTVCYNNRDKTVTKSDYVFIN